MTESVLITGSPFLTLTSDMKNRIDTLIGNADCDIINTLRLLSFHQEVCVLFADDSDDRQFVVRDHHDMLGLVCMLPDDRFQLAVEHLRLRARLKNLADGEKEALS